MAETDQDLVQDETQETETDQQEPQKLSCTVQVTESGPWKKKISITIPRKEIDKELDDQYRELMRTALVPGFRKGRAPRRLVEKRFGTDVAEQTKLKLLAQALEQVEEEQDFEILGEPDFDPEKVELPETGDLEFEYEVEIKPTFELPELEGIRIEKPLYEVTEERIQEALDEWCRRHGTVEELKEGTAEAGDLVVTRATLKIEELDIVREQDDYPVRVGPTAVLGVWFEDMGKVLTGAAVGETKTATTTVPEDHAEETWRGKQAEAILEIKAIRRHRPAELNQELFERLGISDEQELRAYIEENLETRLERETREAMRQQVYAYLDKEIQFELPAGVAARHAGRVLARRYYDLLMNGVPAEVVNERLEELRARSTEQAARELKLSFIMEAVADELKIEVSDGELNGMIAQMAMMQGRRPERLREEMQREGRLEDLRMRMRDERAVDKILEMAEVVDAPEPGEAGEGVGGTDRRGQDQAGKNQAGEEPSRVAGDKPATPEGGKAAGGKASSRKEVKRTPPKTDNS